MLTTQELYRKSIHIIMGLIIIFSYYLDIIGPLTMFLAIIVGILLSLISKHTNLPIISQFLDQFERPAQRHKFPGRGMLFFFIGSLLVMKLFDKDIALASIAILTFGDSISHIIGEKYGEIKNIFNGKSKKLFEGTLAGIFAGFLAALPFIAWQEAFLASFCAMIAEVIQIDLNQNTLDDNIIVPLVAGTTIYLLRRYILLIL